MPDHLEMQNWSGLLYLQAIPPHPDLYVLLHNWYMGYSTAGVTNETLVGHYFGQFYGLIVAHYFSCKPIQSSPGSNYFNTIGMRNTLIRISCGYLGTLIVLQEWVQLVKALKSSTFEAHLVWAFRLKQFDNQLQYHRAIRYIFRWMSPTQSETGSNWIEYRTNRGSNTVTIRLSDYPNKNSRLKGLSLLPGTFFQHRKLYFRLGSWNIVFP